MSANYIPIRIGTIRKDMNLPFDVFVSLSHKYIHYFRADDPVDNLRVQGLKDKGVKKLFIKDSEEPRYLEYLESGLSKLSSADVKIEDKGNMASASMTSEAENIEHNIATEKGYTSVEGRVQKVMDFIISDKGALRSILDSTGCSLDNFQHSANVSSMSVSLAMRLGLKDSRELLNISLAGLLHDIGKTKLNLRFDEVRESMTAEKLKDYKRHPQVGAEMLSSMPHINKDILRLIREHEEVKNGQGFPDKKDLTSLSLSSQILSLCNEFDRISSTKNLPAQEMAKIIFKEIAGRFEMKHITVLGQVVTGK